MEWLRRKLSMWINRDNVTRQAPSPLSEYAKTPADDELYELMREAIEISFSRAKNHTHEKYALEFGIPDIPPGVFSKEQYKKLQDLQQQKRNELLTISTRIRCIKIITGNADEASTTLKYYDQLDLFSQKVEGGIIAAYNQAKQNPTK